MPLAEGGLPGLCFSALGAVVEGAPPLHNFWALRPMAEGAPSEREAPDILSECHPLAAALLAMPSLQCPALKDLKSLYLPPNHSIENTLYTSPSQLRNTHKFFVISSGKRAKIQMPLDQH